CAAFRSFSSGYAAPEFADALVMKRLGRAHENVVSPVRAVQAKLRRHLLVVIDYVVCLLFWRAVVALGRTLDTYPVFVRTRKEERFNSLLSLVTRNCIRHDHRVEMTKMRQAVDVVDGGRDVEGLHLVNRES